ncbi:MAG: DEAD/DEAH box helicase [Myxococcales bacterium]|nr:DEAD/DEAH box helicase [Myxococcales bacterium]
MTSIADGSQEPVLHEPSPEPTFASLGLGADVLEAIDAMGWTAPTPVQAACIEPASRGVDLVVQSRTGTGKTGAFGIPIVDRIASPGEGIQALILAPTRELALQSAREIGKLGEKRGLRTAAVYGGAPMDRQIDELRAGAEIVSGTPGRVLDHLRRGTLDASKLRVLVLDEADEMLSMGFAKELNAILEMLPEDRQTFLFSATVDGPVERMAQRHLKSPERIALSGDAVGALGVSHFIYLVTGLARERDLVRVIEVENPENAIIFCNTKAATESVAKALQQAGYDADWLSGDLTQKEREKVMERTRRGELRFLVATDVAARGIDVSHLTHVINFELPPQLEQYVHRTGRTGRAGRTGTAISLVAPAELGSLYYLRLQYKIFPVERSLPTEGEAKTRAEMDRLAMLVAGATARASAIDRAVARRLLTHVDAESILASMIAAYFGATSGDVDEIAAASRRGKKPAAERPAEREDDAEPAGDDDTVTLYVSLGKRDGMKASELGDWLVEQAGVDRGDLLKIRTREKHSFVKVPADRAEAVIEKISQSSFEDRAVTAEPAKSSA